MIAIAPINFADACMFVQMHHRHHPPAQGHKFSLAVVNAARDIVGVVTVGRPVGRLADDGLTLEVTRCCTDGTSNACSKLYRAAWRATVALGYRKLITYTLETESGASLRGAGFRLVGQIKGGTWDRPSRARIDKAPTQEKFKWELAADAPLQTA